MHTVRRETKLYQLLANIFSDSLEKRRLHTAMLLVGYIEDRIGEIVANDSQHLSSCAFYSRYIASFIQILRVSRLWSLKPQNLQLEAVLLAMRKVGFGGIEQGETGCGYSHASLPGPQSMASLFHDYAVSTQQGLRPLCLRCIQAGCIPDEKCIHKDSANAFST